MANIKWSSFTDGGEMQVNDQTVGLRAGDNRRFNFPGTGIKDADGNYLVGWSTAGALARNYLIFTNAIAGGSPFIIPAGTDADIATLIKSKGNGNIILTPGGTGTVVTSSALILNTSAPTTDLQAASKGYVDSVIPTFPISLAHGGTNASLTASNGGIFYSTATAGAILSGTATANQIILSGASTSPSWSTATYPPTTTINQLLYSSSNNVITGLATANNGLLVTSNTGVPSVLATSGVTGNMLRSNASAAPSWSASIFADTYGINTLLYASSANSVAGLATANNGVLITGVSGVPSISSTLPNAVQDNITRLSTVVSGVWNATTLGSQYGGTGVNNGSSTFTVGGNFALSGSFAFTGTLTGITSVTFPTSGTLATTANIPSLPLSLANGGTAASLAASNGGIVYSGASAFAVLSGTSTANQIIMSGSNTSPSWSSATYPATVAQGDLLYASATNTLTALAKNTTATRYLSNTGTTNNPAWAQIDLTNGVTGILTGTNGGTGVNNGSNTLTLAGNLATSGAFASTFTMTAATNVTFPTSGTLLTSAGAVTSITGTANQVIASASTGSVTLSTPQDIATGSTPTFANLILTGAAIKFTGGLNMLGLSSVASPVNYVNITNSATGNGPTIQSAGSDLTIALNMGAKGAAAVNLSSEALTNQYVFLSGTAQVHSSTMNFAATAAARTYTWPDATGTVLLTAGSGGLKSFQVLTSGTAATYTRPAGITSILVEAVGGGSGGGGCAISTGGGAAGGGGGGGGYCRLWVASAASTYTYTVGASGAGGVAGNNNGTVGTASTFVGTGANISAGPGVVGGGSSISTSPAFKGTSGGGGTSSGGDVNVSGGNGNEGWTTNTTGAGISLGGEGGGTYLRPGVPTLAGTATGTSAVANSGGGGSGASATNNGTAFAGGAGGSGVIIVWEYA